MNMRIGGLASGMDIDQIVNDLMKAERMPLNKLTQQKQLFEWQRDDYREMNKLLKELDDLTFDGVFKQGTFLKKSVSVSDESKLSAKAVNVPSNLSLQLEVGNLASAASWKTTNPIGYTAGARELSFSVLDPGGEKARDVKISISDTDTIDDVIRKINSSTLGVSALKESINDGSGNYKESIVFSNLKTGSGGYIKVKDDTTKNVMQDLGFVWTSSTPDADGFYKLKTDNVGVDAIVMVNGYEMKKQSNDFAINGINITLKNETTSPVTISTSTDVDSILDTVVKFVNKYNEVIEKVNGKITEERFRSYKPLSNEEKEAMTEKQVEMWEEKAKSGIIRGDSILSSGLSQMRMDFYTKVDGTLKGFSQLTEIGIKTSSNYMERGKLIIDETKLREKIAENPDAIYKLFNSDGETYGSKGIARRLRDSIDATIDKIEEKAGNKLKTNNQFVIGKNLINIDRSINAFEDRLTQIEDRYWRQFTAMEKAIQKANSQSMYMMQQFSGGQ